MRWFSVTLARFTFVPAKRKNRGTVSEQKTHRAWGVKVPAIALALLIGVLFAGVLALNWPSKDKAFGLSTARIDNPAAPTNPGAVESQSEMAVSATPPSHTPRFVDLSAHYNAALTNAWHFASGRGPATLRDLPQGVQEFGGVPFEVLGIVQLASRRTIKRPDFPERSIGIPVARRCRHLHFLHATGWKVRDGIQIGSYWIHYADGSAIEAPILYGEHLREWHARSDRIGDISAGKLAWEDKKAGTKHRLFQCRWENPKPEVEVLSVDFVSAMTDCFPFLIAITSE